MWQRLRICQHFWKIFLNTLSAALLPALSFTLPALLLLSCVHAAHGQTETLLHSFSGSPDGATPYASLVKHGKFYGTTLSGGSFGGGTVFEITIKGKEKVLHSFGQGTDGSVPYGSLVFDKLGNLYGTTSAGGTSGAGTVFKMSSSGTETVLYNFTGGADGAIPFAGVILDKEGNLYGTTGVGGTFGAGTVFEISSSGTETVLYSFTGGADGNTPLAGLVRDRQGNLYGTTTEGGFTCIGGSGGDGCGVVFEVTPSGSETVLHAFTGDVADGITPGFGSLTTNLYGTTWFGGENDRGTVFGAGGDTVVYSFSESPSGYVPDGTMILDNSGNLYGTAVYSSANGACGSVFELSPSSGFQVLYGFNPDFHTDGCNPYGGVVFGAKGNLYGTTSRGGIYGKGTVFLLTP
jgi:uncharacterized repeat protein (TIGR03803 family)